MIVTDQPVQKLPALASKRKATLAIHGGAGGTIPPHLPPDLDKAYRDALRRALLRGYEVLSKGGSALDAVCRSVQEMEDDPLFNAARGAVFTKAGGIECEASVMNARPPHASRRQMLIQHDRRCASAILVRNTRNPILLAKVLYENERDNPHVILSGPTAEEIGWRNNTVKVDSTYYYTRKRWLEHRRALGLPDDDDDHPAGCVHPSRAFSADTEPPPSYYANSIRSDVTPSLYDDSVDGKETERETTTEADTPSNQSVEYDVGLQSFVHWDLNFDSGSSSGHDDMYATRSSSFEELSLPARGSSTSLHRRQHLASIESLPAGTVGAVAVDEDGNLAVATSTGGITNKLPGRIGDTPSPSAGFWAEYWKAERSFVPRTVKHNQQSDGTEKEGRTAEERAPKRRRWTACDWVRWIFCAGTEAKENQDEEDAIDQASNPSKLDRESTKVVDNFSQLHRGVAISGTGTGDYFLRSSFASLLAHRMRFLGESVDVAGRKAVAEMAELGGVGGAICIDDAGRVAFPMKTAVMNRGYITHESGPRVAIFANEECR